MGFRVRDGVDTSMLTEFGSNWEVDTRPRLKRVRTWPRSVVGGTLSSPELNDALLWASGSQRDNHGNMLPSGEAFGEQGSVM